MVKIVLPKTQNPEKKLTSILKKHSGRDSTGSVSVRHQGGRQKRYYRHVDFKRDKRDMIAKIETIEYDPNRNAHIALAAYKDGEKRYIREKEEQWFVAPAPLPRLSPKREPMSISSYRQVS